MTTKRFLRGFCFFVTIQATAAWSAGEQLQLKANTGKMRSIDAAKTDASAQASSAAKLIITTLPGSEQIKVSTRKEESSFKASLRKKHLVWIEHQGIVRIVPVKDMATVKADLRKISADSWCDSTSPGLVNSDFPEPTEIIDITRANVLWKGIALAAPDTVKGKVRIVADGEVTPSRACRAWLAALSQIGLTVIHDGEFAVIIPKAQQKTWSWPTRESDTSGPSQQEVTFDYPELTDVSVLVGEYNKQTGLKLLYPSSAARRVRIIAPKPIKIGDLSFLFQTALATVGLNIVGDFVR